LKLLKQKKQFHKNFQHRPQKQNNSPLRGANGEESVNPLLNAPLPAEQHAEQQSAPASTANRNPELPEFRLADIQTWTAPIIVEKMMPGADPEELGTYRKHELIFAAIRSYLSRGGAVLASGCLEIVREGHGFLRSAKNNFLACPEDVFVTQQQIRRHALRTGDVIEGPIRDPRDRDRFFCLGNVNTVNGKEPSVAARVVHFENLTPTFPTRRIILETEAKEYSTRVIDLFTSIGFGQRGLIVAPTRVGKTVLLQKIANAITANHPEAILISLLVDERPEEVTDMQRNTKAMVLSSTFDEEPQHHVAVAEMAIEMSKRQVENGKDVIILLDSITRMARAYNTVQPHSGKILTGGVDALALHRPKRFFGAARNIEGGGSLTIIATGLVETGSRMDEVIFEEFKGTGNMELRLDRQLADRRIFPAIDPVASGTRKEELLLDTQMSPIIWAVRRILANMNNTERAMDMLIKSIKQTDDNNEFLLRMARKAQHGKSETLEF
jgi:transcription termination factor Rho